MTHPPGRTPSRVLAFVLLATMALVPQAMAWADVSPAPATTAHTTSHHHPSGSHSRLLHDDCCDLCLTSCVTCVGLIGAGAVLPYRAAPWMVRAIAVPIAGAPAAPDQHRLPFALGPPVFRA